MSGASETPSGAHQAAAKEAISTKYVEVACCTLSDQFVRDGAHVSIVRSVDHTAGLDAPKGAATT